MMSPLVIPQRHYNINVCGENLFQTVGFEIFKTFCGILVKGEISNTRFLIVRVIQSTVMTIYSCLQSH